VARRLATWKNNNSTPKNGQSGQAGSGLYTLHDGTTTPSKKIAAADAEQQKRAQAGLEALRLMQEEQKYNAWLESLPDEHPEKQLNQIF
jgi:hypothetical protein